MIRFEGVARALTLGALLACTTTSCSTCSSKNEAHALSVAAAADVSLAFKDVGAAFEKESGQSVTFSFGASDVLARQISEGAPFDVFAAADQALVDDVVKSGACLADTKATYAIGHIVIWTKKDAPHKPRILGDLVSDDYKHIAIANPDHAPYGRAAKQAFMTAGMWRAVSAKLVYGENVTQALQLAESGNADAAIVALSIATKGDTGDVVPIDESFHDQLNQAIVVCNGSPSNAKQMLPMARQFAAFVGSPAGQAILKPYGFGNTRAFGVYCTNDSECAEHVCFRKREKERIDAGRERRGAAPTPVEESGYCSKSCDSDADCPSPPTSAHCGARGMCKRPDAKWD